MLEVLNTAPILKDQKGMTLLGVLMSAAIIGIGVFAVVGGINSLVKAKSSISSEINLSQFRGSLISALGTSEGFAQTLAKNPSMICVRNLQDCSAYKTVDTPIAVWSVSGARLTDPTSASYGFNSSGDPCSTFDAVNGNDQCPYRFEVTWRPVCPLAGGPCINPQNQFKGELKFSSQKMITPNLKKFSFRFFPAKMDSTLEQQCLAINGSFDPASRTCRAPMEGLCPAGQIVVRLDSNNNKYCAPLFYGICPKGFSISYIDASGGLTCKPNAFCPAGGTAFSTWIPFNPISDGGDGGGDGCDGSDGCGDGGS